MTFNIYIPENLAFSDYIAVIQVARTWADAQDRKDPERFRATVAPEVTIDYSLLIPAWKSKVYTADDFVATWLAPDRVGLPVLATQHLLGTPYIKSATANEIVMEFQEVASHGRRQDYHGAFGGKIGETADGRGWVEHHYVKIDGQWKIDLIKPSIIYMAGDWERVRRAEGAE
ncbi:NTF2-like protein [Aspergillus campestris IBT 28561]|uniref:NTF2-like protein n=1 Tax=Aspergillus campestris (strain IBT 28561) TaxID=1392248 RepID=A0A2I1DDE6_ASPC2|nr:NTF2-like protein [Aspergillus campestris IBT 28561]PKY07886.1 NTF2-like protein [Aspergillus campestris IBT 28561]